MRTSSFEHIVRLQFNSLMLIVIKNKVKSRNRQLARHSKREVLFCEIAETKQVERGTIDTCFYDCVSFWIVNTFLDTFYENARYSIGVLYPSEP